LTTAVALDFLEGGAMTPNRDHTKPQRDAPATPPLRRFSEGIEAVPSPSSAWRIGRYDDGIAARPDAPSRRRLGSFGDGFEHIPPALSQRRRPALQDTRPEVPRTTLGVEVEAYQALLEGHRAHPEQDQIFDDLLKARAAMERAWLELLAAAPSPEG
jgi:hypothetical protein